jgi:translocation and assembly module TamB
VTLLPRNKWLRWVLSAVYSLVAVVLILGGVVSALLNSENGSRLAVAQLAARINAIPGLYVRYGDSSGTLLRGLAFRELEVLAGDNRLSAVSVEASWNLLTLLNRELSIAGLDIAGLRVRWSIPEQPPGQVVTGLTFSPLPLPVHVDRLQLLDASLQIDEQVVDLDELALADGSLRGDRLTIADLQLRAPQLQVDGDLQMNLRNQVPLSAHLDWRYQGDALSGIADTWRSAAGRLDVQGNLTDLQITHRLDSPLAITSSGTVFTGLFSSPAESLRFSLEHLAPSLVLPFAAISDIQFEDVRLRTAGRPETVNLDLDTRTVSDPLPELRLLASARLQQAAAELDLLEFSITSDSGRLDGRGQLTWGAGFQGDLTLTVEDESPLVYLSGAPSMNLGNLSTALALSFRDTGGGFSVSARIDELAAQLDDYDLVGSGGLQWAAGTLRLDAVELATVNNRLFVSGQIGESMDLQWQIDAPALDQVLVAAAGSLQASGRLGGTAGEPVVEASISGSGLRYGASMPELRSIEVSLTGSQSAHQLRATVNTGLGDLQLALRGGFPGGDWQSWQGSVTTADISSAYGNWLLSDATTLSLSPQSINLQNGCWSFAATRLCAQVSGNPAATVSVSGSLRNLSLGLFNADDPLRFAETSAGLATLPALPDNVALQGMVDTEIAIDFVAGAGYRAQLLAQSDNAGLIVRATGDETIGFDADENPDQFYEFERLVVNGSAQDGGWVFGSEVEFVRNDVDDTALSLRGSLRSSFNLAPDQALDGTVAVQFDDLGWLEALLPQLDAAAGSMAGQVGIAGTLQAPYLVNTNLTLRDAAADIDALGIRVEDVNLSLLTVDGDTLRLQGSAVSGPGQLSVNGSIAAPWEPQRELQLSVTGDDFQLINNPDLHLHVSPDLDLIANRLLIDLRGRLHLPTLDLRLTALPETAVDVSRDTVIVNYPPDRPDLARSIAAEQGTFLNIPVASNLTVSLGDQVRFDGFGLRAGLLGELNIQLEETGASRTYGELSVTDGVYAAYSTELQLEQGKLLFFGAYDNPALDIRAVRRVEDITAGVQMNGTLKNINSQLYSSPALPDNDIIAVLITGKPFAQVGQQDSGALLGAVATLGLDRSQGLTNQIRDQLGLDTLAVENTGDINNSMLTIGKYLSPDLFVRYGVGLFDRQSTVALDYKLTETLTLQAESGEYQSLDITYRIER